MGKSVILWFTSAIILMKISHGDYPWRKSTPNIPFLSFQASEVTKENGNNQRLAKRFSDNTPRFKIM